MVVPFAKYTGCGNDFVLIDNRQQVVKEVTPAIVSWICNRHHGIGADGVIFLTPSPHADYRMRIFNSNGSEAEMCGNGLRCLVRYIHDRIDNRLAFTIETMERVLNTRIVDDLVEIEMGEPTETSWEQELNIEGKKFCFSRLNTGVPHLVFFVEDLKKIDLEYWGKLLRHHPHFFPNGTNVNAVEIKGSDRISIRTYERGVEKETLACGTGATAAALTASLLHQLNSPVEVEVQSGDNLKITFDKKNFLPKNICLLGPAISLFDGHFRINSIK